MHLHRALVELKEATWRQMHSYVHGGIHAFVHSLVGHRARMRGSSYQRNGMLITATNLPA